MSLFLLQYVSQTILKLTPPPKKNLYNLKKNKIVIIFSGAYKIYYNNLLKIFYIVLVI